MSQDLDRFTTIISNFQRREIQIPLAACLLRGFVQAIGYDEAVAVATAEIQKEAMISGRKMAEQYGGNSLDELLRVVKDIWAQEGALEFDILENTGQILSFDVHRCRYVELYDQLGVKEFGYCLSCCRDASYARGFNNRIKLFRSHTIMQGAIKCDFRFILE